MRRGKPRAELTIRALTRPPDCSNFLDRRPIVAIFLGRNESFQSPGTSIWLCFHLTTTMRTDPRVSGCCTSYLLSLLLPPHSRCLSALLPISLSTSLYTLFTADLCPLFFGALERLDSASGRDDFPTLIGLTYRRHKPETLRLPTQLVTISQPTDQRYISVYQLQLMSPVWKFLTSTKAVHEVSALRF